MKIIFSKCASSGIWYLNTGFSASMMSRSFAATSAGARSLESLEFSEVLAGTTPLDVSDGFVVQPGLDVPGDAVTYSGLNQTRLQHADPCSQI